MRILVLYYTQSGQLKEVCDRFLQPFAASNCEVVYEELKPVTPYPFPWSSTHFFSAFPETFQQQKIELQPLSTRAYEKYDAVVLAYTVWFLTPSPPIASFLQSDDANKILNGKRVVTLIACRNMWLNAQHKVKQHLARFNTPVHANVALVDTSPNLASIVTILRWMLTGKKNAFWFFPAAGIQTSDMEKCVLYGEILLQHFDSPDLQQRLLKAGATDVKPELVLLEKRGQRAFTVWSRFIGGAAAGSTARLVRVKIFTVLLPTVVFLLAPILALVSKLLLIFKRDSLMKEVEYHQGNAIR